MDPITHGIAGSLLGKSYFAEKRGRVALFAVTLGSVFPDVDVVCHYFTNDPLATIRFHRGFTHSFIGLPVFAAALAWLTIWWQRRRNKECPSFGVLFAAYAVGIASHIFLDAMTSYGTRIWNPISAKRYAWDWLFIVDFTLTAAVLAPQIVAWVYRDARKALLRATMAWAVFAAATMGVWRIAELAGYGFSLTAAAIIVGIFAWLFFFPMAKNFGAEISRAQWCRAGVYVTLAYLLTCATAHARALDRVRAFAEEKGLAAMNEAAIPLPPSLLHWDGMIRTTDGVYRARFSLTDRQVPTFGFLAGSAPNPILTQAMALPEVQTYLWFARFPVIRTYEENGNGVAEFLDVRFAMRNPHDRAPFTFRVVMDPQGRPLEDEWVLGASGVHFRRQRKVFSRTPEQKQQP